jgi:hypothetical protein
VTVSQAEVRVTRDQVLAAVRSEHSWEAAAQSLHVRPGLAFMVATGVPADGSGVPALERRTGPGPSPSSPQSLVNPRGHNPLRNEVVDAWVRARAQRELNVGAS